MQRKTESRLVVIKIPVLYVNPPPSTDFNYNNKGNEIVHKSRIYNAAYFRRADSPLNKTCPYILFKNSQSFPRPILLCDMCSNMNTNILV